MKYCLHLNQSERYLKKADEIRIQYKDRAIILDCISKYNADLIIDCFNADEIDWEEIDKINDLSGRKIIMCVRTVEDLSIAQDLFIRAYIGFPIESFYELNSLVNFEPEYIICGPELFFDLPTVRKFGIKIRVTPNIAYKDIFPHEDGIHGMWIRPEDLNTIYREYVDAVEFEDCGRDKEQALYRIYAEEKKWDNALLMIFTNFHHPAIGRLVSSEVAEARLTCHHKCQRGRTCRICQNGLNIANPDRLQEYQDSLKELS